MKKDSVAPWMGSHLPSITEAQPRFLESQR